MAGLYPDDQELTIFGEKIKFPGLDSSGKFTNGNFNDPKVPASFIPAETINLMLDNLNSLIEGCGLTPNNTSAAQLKEAIEKKFKDYVYPIAPYYVQYPDTNGNFNPNEEPSNWYKKMYGVTTTWQIMFNTESVYFRTEGDLSNADRVNGIQGDAIRNIVGRSNDVSPLASTASQTPFSGALYFDLYQTNTFYKAQNVLNQPWGYIELCIDASRVVPIASENRVRNRLIRIYRLLTINGRKVSDIIGA